MRRSTALPLALLLLLAASGCATTSAVMWLADAPPEDGAYARQTARSTPTTNYRVEPASTVPLQVNCSQTTRWPMVHTQEAYHTWGTGWRVIGGLMAVAEGGIAFGFLQDGIRNDRQSATIAGTVAAIDALATVALIVLKDGRWRTRVTDGPHVLESRRCPDGVTVDIADKSLPVYENGQLAAGDAGWFQDAILGGDGTARLRRPDGTFVDLYLTRQQRCQTAQQFGLPAAAWACDPAQLQQDAQGR